MLFMKKSKFMTIILGACFGAGQMYLGMYKKGITLMGGIAAFIAVANFIDCEELLVFVPVVWFYAFFDALNGFYLTEEERKLKDDQFSQQVSGLLADKEVKLFIEKRNTIIGWGLIIIGIYVMFGQFIGTIANYFNNWFYSSVLWNMYNQLPRLVLALLVVIVGLKLIGYHKLEMKKEESQGN